MQISVDEARAYFAHPSQQIEGLTPDNLPTLGIEYRACGGLCGAFSHAGWPGIWMAHYGAMPGAWGRLEAPALAILKAFWAEKQPQRIIGWTRASNRAALAFSKRIGFVVDGIMPIAGDALVMQGWTCH